MLKWLALVCFTLQFNSCVLANYKATWLLKVSYMCQVTNKNCLMEKFPCIFLLKQKHRTFKWSSHIHSS